MRRIAVGFANGIGNFIIYTSAIQALATIAEVDLVLSDRWESSTKETIRLMAQNMPFICDVVDYPSSFEEKHDRHYMTLHSYSLDPFLLFVNGPKVFDSKNYSAWAQTLIHEQTFYYEEIRHQFKYKGSLFPQYMPVQPFELSDKKRITVANGWLRTEQGLWERKAYPYFAELLSTISKLYPEYEICLTGGPDDIEWADSINNSSHMTGVINYVGLLNIMETAYLIDQSDLVICNDGSVMHIADALKKRGICLWGPTLVSKNGPLNGTIANIQAPLRCAPCQNFALFKECEQPECMKAIRPGYIMNIVRKVLK